MAKLCTEEVIWKLVDLLREVDLDKFDKAVAQAKSWVLAEQKMVKRNGLEKLFDSQIATLKDRGTPEQIVEMLANQRSSVVSKAREMTFEDWHIPFLPVIPRTYRSPYDLMSAVRHDGMGYTCLDPMTITDRIVTPDEPYYVYDVEDGESTLNESSKDVENILESQKRLLPTAAEVVALTTHTDVLSRHYVRALGSQYESAINVTGIYLCGGRPKLVWVSDGGSDLEWGSPSLGSR